MTYHEMHQSLCSLLASERAVVHLLCFSSIQ